MNGLPARPDAFGSQPTDAATVKFPQSVYSSHYAQAYLQAAAPAQQPYLTHHAPPSSLDISSSAHSYNQPKYPRSSTSYQNGSIRCTYNSCAFSGSQKTVEIHMMDRHLIYPPGWDLRKKKDDWDTDPCLKGKPIPIQGTNVLLETPESVEAWLAERKRRWPTAARVEDKKRKLNEAIERGQLPFDDAGLRPPKRQTMNDSSFSTRIHAPGKSRGRGQLRERGRGRAVDGGWRGRMPGAKLAESSNCSTQLLDLTATKETLADDNSNPQSSDSSDDEDGAPQIASSKVTAGLAIEDTSPPSPQTRIEPRSRPKKALAPRPKQQVFNMFNSRPSLLRNLLLPEIRVTVSNLSQVIRFLVDNDFLRGVELKPGDSSKQKITVLAQDVAKPAGSRLPLPVESLLQ